MSKKKKALHTMTIKVDQSKVKTFTEKGDYEKHVDSIKWGNGVHKAKKGKGSFTRKEKHKKRTFSDHGSQRECSFLFLI